MATHPHLEGLIRKWRLNASALDSSVAGTSGLARAETYRSCADQLQAALAALPGGGVDEEWDKRMTLVNALRQVGFDILAASDWTDSERDALTAALSPADQAGRYPEDALRDALLSANWKTTPTPNPHEADQ